MHEVKGPGATMPVFVCPLNSNGQLSGLQPPAVLWQKLLCAGQRVLAPLLLFCPVICGSLISDMNGPQREAFPELNVGSSYLCSTIMSVLGQWGMELSTEGCYVMLILLWVRHREEQMEQWFHIQNASDLITLVLTWTENHFKTITESICIFWVSGWERSHQSVFLGASFSVPSTGSGMLGAYEFCTLFSLNLGPLFVNKL